MNNQHLTRLMLGFMLFVVAGMFLGARAQNAQSMQQTYSRIKTQLDNSPLKSPILIESSQSDNKVSGEVYGLLDKPFAAVEKNLQDPVGWCEVLFLHLNVKFCKVIGKNTVQIYAGSKKPQKLSSATEMKYQFKNVSTQSDYMKVAMVAADGPYGTSNYNIVMEAAPVGEKTFTHVTYNYQFGKMAKLAMNTYLSTSGAEKEGLSVVGKKADGSPEYVTGLRGVIERNTLRYFLAINAFLSYPAESQLETRLASWFSATERYPQLHEISRSNYLSMKREEHQRMVAGGESDSSFNH